MERKYTFPHRMIIFALMLIIVSLTTQVLLSQTWTSVSGPAIVRNIVVFD
jgi:hypothetical protein